MNPGTHSILFFQSVKNHAAPGSLRLCILVFMKSKQKLFYNRLSSLDHAFKFIIVSAQQRFFLVSYEEKIHTGQQASVTALDDIHIYNTTRLGIL